jgi:uncharacterized RDD family membrane protein YckC
MQETRSIPAGGGEPVTAYQTAGFIESRYRSDQLQTASPARRLGATVLDGLLGALVIWAGVVGAAGSTVATSGTGVAGGGAAFGLVLFVLAVVGWWAFSVWTWSRGQSPGKYVLHLYVMRDDGSRAGGWYTFGREFLVKQLLFGVLISVVTVGLGWLVAAVWLLWDRNTQTLWDKVARTYVAHSPGGYLPATRREREAADRR